MDFDVSRYDFEVLKGDRVISAARSVALGDLAAAWSMISEMALATDEAGCRIRVTDEIGAIVILTGVAAARLHTRPDIAA
ncbi:MAG: hypothetical protein ACLPSW_21535 [Roseiarcus sp.]